MSQKRKKELIDQRPSWFKQIFKIIIFLGILGILLTTIAVFVIYQHYSKDLPDFSKIHDYRPPLISRVYDRNGIEIGAFFKERRTLVKLDQVSPHLINAILSAEDADFYQHQGLDYKGILRAILNSVKAGKLKGSGSTISQQTVKNILLNQEKSFRRKMKELILTYHLEGKDSQVSKDDILYLYINTIYLGHGRFGVQEASQYYFGKNAKDLNIAESAMLAGVIQSPENHSPRKNPENTMRRRSYVLKEMMENGKITALDYEQAMKSPLLVIDLPNQYPVTAQWFVQEIKKQVIHLLAENRGLSEEEAEHLLSTGGFDIYTTLDLQLQEQAQAALRFALKAVDQRQDYLKINALYTKPKKIKRVIEYTEKKGKKTIKKTKTVYEEPADPGLTAAVFQNWKEKQIKLLGKNGIKNGKEVEAVFLEQKKNQLIFELGNTQAYLDAAHLNRIGPLKYGDMLKLQVKDANVNPVALDLEAPQGTLIAMDPSSRELLAMVGGWDFEQSPYNRAIQAKRQLGSAFKPFLWGAAIQQTFDLLQSNGGIANSDQKLYHPATILMDSPETWNIPGSPQWTPKNYDGKFDGEMSMQAALAKSKNTVAVRMLDELGIDRLKAFSEKAGISFQGMSQEAYNLTLALGSIELTPLEACNAFATIGADGKYVKPKFILGIRQGKEELPLSKSLQGESIQSIDPNVIWVLREMMRAVVLEGTASALKAYPYELVGKTGTSNESKDTWFISTLSNLTIGAWIGFDQPKKLYRKEPEAGGKTAVPAVKYFLEHINYPIRTWQEKPAQIISKWINPVDGLLLDESDLRGKWVSFLSGSEPKVFSASPEQQNENDFFYGETAETDTKEPSPNPQDTNEASPNPQDTNEDSLQNSQNPKKTPTIDDLF